MNLIKFGLLESLSHRFIPLVKENSQDEMEFWKLSPTASYYIEAATTYETAQGFPASDITFPFN